jgi:hypothetical protein
MKKTRNMMITPDRRCHDKDAAPRAAGKLFVGNPITTRALGDARTPERKDSPPEDCTAASE